MRGKTVAGGTRLQAGLVQHKQGFEANKARGLLLRGVVLTTYVSDDSGHPAADDTTTTPLGVYCDVLIYGSIPGQRWVALKEVLVSQPRGSMHSGNIWKPKATTMDLTGVLTDEEGSNPAYLDGDHVLVGFMNDSLSEPIILGGLPHPSLDVGNEDYGAGTRMKLKVTDGNPDLWKHNGIFHGVTDAGMYVVDSTFANDGELAADGKEAAPPTDGKGTQSFLLPKDATLNIITYDMSVPASPAEESKLEVSDTALKFSLGGAAANHSMAFGDLLQILYTALKGKFDAHTHAGSVPVVGAPEQAPVWDANIESNAVFSSD